MNLQRIIDDDLENLIEAIVELPIISILELQMWTEGHCYGPVILHLLSQCNSIDDLLVYLAPIKVNCLENKCNVTSYPLIMCIVVSPVLNNFMTSSISGGDGVFSQLPV